MDTPALTQLIQNSYLLSDAQRSYWVQQLPLMKPDQKVKLEEILAGSDKMPFQQEMENYLLSLGRSLAHMYGVKAA